MSKNKKISNSIRAHLEFDIKYLEKNGKEGDKGILQKLKEKLQKLIKES